MAACWIAAGGERQLLRGERRQRDLERLPRREQTALSRCLPTTTPTAGGPIDLAVSSDGRFVYSENGGAGTIDEFRVETNGALTPIGQITGLQAHVIEGLAAV